MDALHHPWRRRVGWGLAVAFTLSLSTGLFAQGTVAESTSQPEGLIVPFREVTLGAVVLGRIDEIHFREGDRVRAGDLLLEMDTAMQELEVERRDLVRQTQVELEIAHERVTTLRQELESTRELFEKSRSISQEEVNRKKLDYQTAVAEVERLKREQQLAEVAYRMAVEEMEQRRIHAPHDGTVSEILVEAGEICQPGQPLLEMVDSGRCYLEVHLDTSQTNRLERGREVRLAVPVDSGQRTVTGTVDLIFPTVDAASGLRKVRILFDNPDRAVTPGLTARVLLDGLNS